MNNNLNDLKVCVAICNYNHQKYLKESIQSIIGQVYKNLDIVVVDDGSDNKESFREIINSFSDNRLRTIELDKNYGKWKALNEAFKTTDALVCTSHDADDISLNWRISTQLYTMSVTNSVHNLCGFIHCFSEEDIKNNLSNEVEKHIKIMKPEDVYKLVKFGKMQKNINHYFTGDFETAGVSSMFLKSIWEDGIRFNPPNLGLRTLLSEDSDFNLRMTTLYQNTSILMEKPYLYRRNTSTNKEEF